MFDETVLKNYLESYKKDFPLRWPKEKFKWEAVKTFQDYWNVDADDFADMLSKALSKTEHLLTSYNYFPLRMITDFAKESPEEVRDMFIDLFDRAQGIVERVDGFETRADALHKRFKNEAKQSYQDENAITTYLWLRYPDKYYIYKFTEANSIANCLDSDYTFKKSDYVDNLKNFFALYDEICAYIRTDSELTDILRTHLTDSCYPDPEYRTLTIDVGSYISRGSAT